MSEFTFACPVCGQHIKCESWRSNTVMECPTCFQKITVPQAPAAGNAKFIIAGTKAGGRPIPTAGADAGPATAPEKHFPMIAFVLVFLLCAAVAAAVVFRGKIFKTTGGQTNQVATVSVQKPAPPQPAIVVAPPANDTNWMLNLDAATIPDSAVVGRIHGQNFICARAIFQNGVLTLRADRSGPMELGLTINFQGAQAEAFSGKSIDVNTNADKAARVTLRWPDNGQVSKASFDDSYALRLEFGALAGNRLPGKIYFCAPDETKSYIAGTFNAEIRRPKPPKPKQ